MPLARSMLYRSRMMSARALRMIVAAVLPATLLGSSPTAHADEVRVEATEPGLSLWNRSSQVAMVPVRYGRNGITMERSYLYDALCTNVPCVVNLDPGLYALGLSRHGGAVVEGPAVSFGGPSAVTASYHDRFGWRAFGVVSIIAGIAGGTGLFLASNETASESTFPTLNPLLVGLAIGVALGGIVAGAVMTAQSDSATFTVTPLNLAPTGRWESGVERTGTTAGGGMTVRF
jgi:hypothetical protein